MSKKILILVPHFDDDVLSFGGLISVALRRGDAVKVHVFTCGGPCSNVSGEIRAGEYKLAMESLGVTDYTYSGEGLDGRLDTVPNCTLTTMIDKMIQEYKPDEVYCGAYSEHADHKALYEAFMASARLKTGYIPKLFAIGTYPFSDQLYSSPVGGKIFQPLTQEDFDNKLNAFSCYQSQLKPAPSPLGVAGVINQAKYNGMMCGAEYAELYYQLRYIRGK